MEQYKGKQHFVFKSGGGDVVLGNSFKEVFAQAVAKLKLPFKICTVIIFTKSTNDLEW